MSFILKVRTGSSRVPPRSLTGVHQSPGLTHRRHTAVQTGDMGLWSHRGGETLLSDPPQHLKSKEGSHVPQKMLKGASTFSPAFLISTQQKDRK